ncbi:protein FAR1-RELATED SEQUENCE 6-like [Spinacia oleracea]|uniref:Protein FAR1-RELATED SEQUENCE n=1 Tax=Spinacia oleracea TaxID=3562 RepID=A0A9R0IGJ8_SPIOL|nr:protein FAR1-RELATED SEQUENCE 6-like [Spinacia oleracea]
MNKEEVKLNLSGGDARAMVDYFNKLTADNQNFFHMERYAEGGGLQDIVWVDARSRATCKEFGDDPAMRRALKETKKDTTHRWCLWHILKKFPKYLNKHENYEDLKAELENVIYNSNDPVTFEMAWNDVIVHYVVKYNSAYKWLEVYTKDVFWAGTRTIQRSESYNHFLKGYVDRNTYLYQFVQSYLKAMAKKAMDEHSTYRSDQRFIRQLATVFHVETLFRKIYTDRAYSLVQEEVRKICYKTVTVSRTITCDSGTIIEYIFYDRKWIKPKNSRAAEILTENRVQYVVTYHSSTHEAYCQCKGFECKGILCRHVIKVYDMKGVREDIIPEKFILQRWWKDIPRKIIRVKVSYHDPSKTEDVIKYDSMMRKLESICSKASSYQESMSVVTVMMSLMDIRVDEVIVMVNQNKLKAEQAAFVTNNKVLGTSSSVANDKVVADTPQSVAMINSQCRRPDQTPVNVCHK